MEPTNILKDLDIEKLSPEEQDTFLAQVGEMIFQGVTHRALMELSEADNIAFNNFLDSNPEMESIYAFLAERIPHFDTIVNEEVARVKEDLALLKS